MKGRETESERKTEIKRGKKREIDRNIKIDKGKETDRKIM
jgi:hypothetical protein